MVKPEASSPIAVQPFARQRLNSNALGRAYSDFKLKA
jgi:hypothetical protein